MKKFIRITNYLLIFIMCCALFSKSSYAQQKVTNAVYLGDEAYDFETERTFTVYAESTGAYEVNIDSIKDNFNVFVKINGSTMGEVVILGKERFQVNLNKGINSLTFTDGTSISKVTIRNCADKKVNGATVNYIEYEAENGETNGRVIGDNRTYRSFSSEASGKKYVELSDEGDYISFSLQESANALVLRYCIPDSSDGVGLDLDLNMYIKEERTEVPLTSRYSWVYGDFPWTNNPTDGGGHYFFDDVRIRLDQTYPAGTVIKFQKDKENDSAFYLIDLIEAEVVDAPLEIPENALSITQFKAISNDGVDDTAAIAECIQQATKEGKEVFIPEGEFLINNPVYVKGFMLINDNVVIRGAGMWHSVLRGEAAAFYIRAANISFYDFSLLGNVKRRRDSVDPPAFSISSETRNTRNIRIQNVWMEHWKVGVWSEGAQGIHILGCRIRNTLADGINLCRGTSHSMVEQIHVRNTGDDGIAMWSIGVANTNNKIRYNTVSLPWLANNIAVYGGRNLQITDNLLKDTIAFGSAVNISTRFTPQAFEGEILVARNQIERCGSREHHINKDYGAIWFNTIEGYNNHAEVIIKDNQIWDSTYQGISFLNSGIIDNLVLENNMIDQSGTFGIEMDSRAKGKVVLKNNVIKNTGKIEIQNNAEENFIVEIIESKNYSITAAFILGSLILLLGIVLIIRRRKHVLSREK